MVMICCILAYGIVDQSVIPFLTRLIQSYPFSLYSIPAIL